jgi:hypothetical protein
MPDPADKTGLAFSPSKVYFQGAVPERNPIPGQGGTDGADFIDYSSTGNHCLNSKSKILAL